MNKIALSMIVKGGGKEPERLRGALSSIQNGVDDIFITYTGTDDDYPLIDQICTEFKANLARGQFNSEVTQDCLDWIKNNLGYESHLAVGEQMFSFEDARNFALSQIPKTYDWIFWMDCDDIVRRAENIKPLVKVAERSGYNLVHLNYLYSVEKNEAGEITRVAIQHPRERLVRNDGTFHWKGRIHEIFYCDKPMTALGSMDVDVVHGASIDDNIASLNRNIKSLEYTIYKEDGKNSRTMYYLAKVFYDLRQDEYDVRAQKLMFEFVAGPNKSDWSEEKAQAWGNIAEIYRRHTDLDQAIISTMNGLIDYPESPSLFIGLGTTYAMKGDWKRSLFWLSIAESIPTPPSLLQDSPLERELRILEIKYNCYYNLGMFDKVRETVMQISKIFPNSPIALAGLNNLEQKLNLPLTNG